MADTYTTNLNMTKPEVGASTDSWGTKLNADLDTLDAIFAAGGTAVNVKFASANFDDNAKAIFGTGDDLEIYHDGSNSYIKDGGTGDLRIASNDLYIKNGADTETKAYFLDNGAVGLYYDDAVKFATTSSGITVTGNIANTSGDMTLDVAGNIILDADGDATKFADGGTEYGKIYGASSNLYVSSTVQDKDILFVGDDGGSSVTALTLDMSDAGTATFNSNVNVGGIGNVNLSGSASEVSVGVSGDTDNSGGGVSFAHNTSTLNSYVLGQKASMTVGSAIATPLIFVTNNTERMRINSSGRLGVGTTGGNAGITCSGDIRATGASFGNDANSLTMSQESGGSYLTSRGPNTSTRGTLGLSVNRSNGGGGIVGVLINNDGSVTIQGALSKGSGSFKIDHPLESKKDTHHLVHSFIEGPQADLIYRGVVVLENGTATINLDTVSGMSEGTYVLLNTNTSCFTSNETDWDAVKGSVTGNILTINCQNTSSTATVSWLVIGERQDQHMKDANWTDENGKVIVEPLKEKIT